MDRHQSSTTTPFLDDPVLCVLARQRSLHTLSAATLQLRARIARSDRQPAQADAYSAMAALEQLTVEWYDDLGEALLLAGPGDDRATGAAVLVARSRRPS